MAEQTKFHIGDTVIVMPIGTMSTVSAVVCATGGPTCYFLAKVGYQVMGFGLTVFTDNELELAFPGNVREAYEDFLKRQREGSVAQ